MGTRKLTLSVPEDVIRDAKRVAEENGTSVSAMFTRLFRAAARERRSKDIPLGPTTLRASGIARLPSNRSDDQLLEDALAERYDGE